MLEIATAHRQLEARLPHHSKGRMLKICFDALDAAPWLVDDPGYLQRWNGKRFAIVAVAALAARVHECEPGAEMVLEDALRERDLWG